MFFLSNGYVEIDLSRDNESGQISESKGVLVGIEDGQNLFNFTGTYWKVMVLTLKYQYSFEDSVQFFGIDNESASKIKQSLSELVDRGVLTRGNSSTSQEKLVIEADDSDLFKLESTLGEMSIVSLDALLGVEDELAAYATGCCGCYSSGC